MQVNVYFAYTLIIQLKNKRCSDIYWPNIFQKDTLFADIEIIKSIGLLMYVPSEKICRMSRPSLMA